MGCLHNKCWPLCMAMYIHSQSCLRNHKPRNWNSCKQNENIVLHESSLWPVHVVPAWAHICLYSHWFQCGEIVIVPSYSIPYTQAICDDPKQPLNPAFSMNDRLSMLHVLCLASGVTLLCSFLCCPQGGRLVCDWSLLYCEPSSQKSTEVLNYTSPIRSTTVCV